MKLLLLSCAVGVLSFTHCSANLIVNGSFEAPVIPNGTYYIGPIPGWTSTVGAGGEIQHNAAGAAYDGVQLLELDSNNNSNLFQDVPTTPGAGYSLSFQYSPRPGIGTLSNPVEVYFGGSLLGTLTGNGGTATAWAPHSYNVFGGAGTSTRLLFLGAGTSDSLGGYIDDVKMNNVPDGGSAAALLGLGLLGIVATRRQLNA